MSSEAMIELRDIHKHYRLYARPQDRLLQMVTLGSIKRFSEFRALNGVSLSINRSETVGIVGRNGCGKSTLLQILYRTLQPTSGTVTTHGRISALLELGAGFDPQFTGRENVYMNGALQGFTREEIDARFDDIVAFADIGDFINHPVKTYSSGMFVRLAFAVAVSANPDILIVDEALAVGDEAFQRKCMARIEQIQENGGTILFVSHSVQAVIQLCNRAILLDRGEKLMDGDPKDVTVAYQRLVNAEPAKMETVRQLIQGKSWQEAVDDSDTVADPDTFRQSNKKGDGSYFNPGLISKSMMAYEQRGAEISNVRILNAHGESVNMLTHGSTYRYCYNVRFSEDANSVGFGFLIKTPDGLFLGGTNTRLNNKNNVKRVKNGEFYEIEVSFVCRMNPAYYFFNAGVESFNGKDVFFMHRIIDAVMVCVIPLKSSTSTSFINFDCETRAVLKDTNKTKRMDAFN